MPGEDTYGDVSVSLGGSQASLREPAKVMFVL